MGYKNDDRCLNKVADDEPIFVFRAQDKSAPGFVRIWAESNRDTLTEEHYIEAIRHADVMEKWQEDNLNKVKWPD